MTPELRELYQEVILDHGRKPRNFHELAGARKAEGFNPLCGDKATVYVDLQGDLLRDVAFVGKGCSVSTASASMMTENVKGKTLADAESLFERFHALIAGASEKGVRTAAPELGKLTVFSGVCEFPMRIKVRLAPLAHAEGGSARGELPVSHGVDL